LLYAIAALRRFADAFSPDDVFSAFRDAAFRRCRRFFMLITPPLFADIHAMIFAAFAFFEMPPLPLLLRDFRCAIFFVSMLMLTPFRQLLRRYASLFTHERRL